MTQRQPQHQTSTPEQMKIQKTCIIKICIYLFFLKNMYLFLILCMQMFCMPICICITCLSDARLNYENCTGFPVIWVLGTELVYPAREANAFKLLSHLSSPKDIHGKLCTIFKLRDGQFESLVRRLWWWANFLLWATSLFTVHEVNFLADYPSCWCLIIYYLWWAPF